MNRERTIINRIKEIASNKKHDGCGCSLGMEILQFLETYDK